MNFLRRLVAWFRTASAVFTGHDPAPVRALPHPVAEPNVTVPGLVAEADARGRADGAAQLHDHWSFGGEDDDVSDERDPEYVRALRFRCAAAVAELHDRNALTVARLSHVYAQAQESDQFMAAARRRMGTLAAWEADRERVDLVAALNAGRPAGEGDASVVSSEALAAHESHVWEGEARPLPALVRLAILGLLVAIEYPVQHYVFAYYLATSDAQALTTPVAVSAAVLVVLAPYLAGVLYRGRRATGGERRLGLVVAVLALPWLYAAGMLGFLRGRILEIEAVQANSGSPQLNVIPLTVIIMFVALLLVAGLMAFMLGLSRRHPFQDAYVRSRRRHDRLQEMAQRMAAGINPNFRGPDDRVADNRLVAAEQALRAAYAAAEESYFAALTAAVGDPTFTEAVSRRRGRRPAADAAPADPAVPAEAP